MNNFSGIEKMMVSRPIACRGIVSLAIYVGLSLLFWLAYQIYKMITNNLIVNNRGEEK